MYLGARRVRRRGGVAAVFRQVEQGPDARGSGADRRHLPAARAPEPVRRHEARDRRGATTCCSGWPTRATSRRRRPTQPSRSRSSRAASRRSRRGIAPFFVEEVRKHLEQRVRREGALRERPRGHDDARRRRCSEIANRAIEHGLRRARQTARLPQADAQRHRRRARRSTAIKDERWTRPIAVGDIVPAVVVGRRRRKTGAGAPADRRATTPTSRATGYRVDAPRVGRRSVQAGRPDRCRRSSKLDEADSDGDGRRSSRRRSPKARCVAIDNRTGQIKAMVGGWSFSRSKFNRAVQAYRQIGLDLQADRLHGGDRSRLHAGVDHRSTRRSPTPPATARLYSAAELRPQVRGPGHAAPRARGVAQHPGDQDDGRARAEERRSTTRSDSGSTRTSRRTCRSRSAPATRRCSR